MDGVLTDFDKRFKSLNPEHLTAAQYQAKNGIEKFWDFIDVDNKIKFWVGMEWMPDGKVLWDYIKDKQPTLLSAPSRNPASRLGKIGEESRASKGSVICENIITGEKIEAGSAYQLSKKLNINNSAISDALSNRLIRGKGSKYYQFLQEHKIYYKN